MKRWNISAISGFVCCFGMIVMGIATNGGIGTILNFIHIPSMLVTFGGALFAVMVTSDSYRDYFEGLASLMKAFRRRGADLDDIGEEIFALSTIARKDGLLSLEERMDSIEDPFMKKGIRLTVDGTDPELIKDILETEMLNHIEEEKKHIRFWQDLGMYGPAWGMVGTLLGLINMMKSMGSDPAAVGQNMSLALLTTLYGSVLANWLCIPVAAKLKKDSLAEESQMGLIIEGVLSIQAGENPMVVKEKIRAFRNDWEENKAA